MLPNPQETADLVTFTEDILNGKLQSLCSAVSMVLCFSRSICLIEVKKCLSL